MSHPQTITNVSFGALSFIGAHADVFRRYFFLPTVLSVASVFAAKLPVVGLSGSTVLNSLAMALLGVAVTRFTLFGTKDAVQMGANRAFARFFFLTFFMTALGHMPILFEMLPKTLQPLSFSWMIALGWYNLKIVLAYPALATDHPGSVRDVVTKAFGLSNGRFFQILGITMVSYSPAIFFLMLIGNVDPDGLGMDPNGFVLHWLPLIFNNIVMMFCVLWSSVAFAQYYKVVLQDAR